MACMHTHVHVCDGFSVYMWMCVCWKVNAGELFFQCHIFGMVVLCPRLLHSWWISMQCGVVTGTGADMLSHCDEKHSEMMWRECSSCPQRDGKLAVAFVYSFVLPLLCESMCVCILVGFSLGALVIVYGFCSAFKPISLYHAKCVVLLLLCFWCSSGKAISEHTRAT